VDITVYEPVFQVYQAKSRHRQLINEVADQRRIKRVRDVASLTASSKQQVHLPNNRIGLLKNLSRIRRIRVKIFIETQDPCLKCVG